MTNTELTALTDCKPSTIPCWMFYGEHRQHTFITQWVIDLAIITLKLRSNSISNNPSFEELWALKTDAQTCIDLINHRWRDINQDPFTGKPYSSKTVSDTTPQSTIRQLLLDLGLGPKPITKRRF